MPDGVTPISLGTAITEEEAEQLFQEDTAVARDAVNAVSVARCGAGNSALTQNQFDALCSLIFNIGVEAFDRSHVRLYIITADDLLAKPGGWHGTNRPAKFCLVSQHVGRPNGLCFLQSS